MPFNLKLRVYRFRETSAPATLHDQSDPNHPKAFCHVQSITSVLCEAPVVPHPGACTAADELACPKRRWHRQDHRQKRTLGRSEMTEIEALLTNGKSARDDEVAAVTENDLRAVELALNFAFPASYREFLGLGGHAELRVAHRVLRPSEILEMKQQAPQLALIPFADNGCGDFFGWSADSSKDEVLFWDHERSALGETAMSFTEWLRQSRC
ncbi:MAG: SMI1/KNR4 family protein [Polaromonas sp.]|nr:SMI1/KNR4 family protein [Polaromonas sp.]